MMCEFGIVLLVKYISNLKKRREFVEIWNNVYPVLLFVLIMVVGMFGVIKAMR
ncbi:MAG: hypothetical protein K6G88_03010 [Lachnospiraceae bacterium]|nr:hypothetical protein [Lachnospiraceae bacterium]